MLNWLYTLADWLMPDRDRPEWRPARLEVSPSGFAVERPKAAPIVVPWDAVVALSLTAIRRRGTWGACLLVSYRPGRQQLPVLATWGNFPAFAAELGARLGERDPARWAESIARMASSEADIEIPLPAGGLRPAEGPVLGRGV
jgi:hypothetical protein